MKLYLKNFRSVLDNEYSFNSNIVLLSGVSGSGKSTIFQSIFWCLFGSLRNITPNDASNSTRTNVIIDLDYIIINRINRPNLLTITYNNTRYENDIAQSIINNIFGNKDIWKVCCYIEQGELCSFLTLPNNDKMEILNRLSFLNDDPEKYIGILDTEIKSKDLVLNNLTNEYNSSMNMYNNYINENKNYIKDIIKTEEEIQSKLKELNQTKPIVYTKVLEYNKNKGIYETLIKKINELKSIPIKLFDSVELDNIKKEIQELNNTKNSKISEVANIKNKEENRKLRIRNYEIDLNKYNNYLTLVKRFDELTVEAKNILEKNGPNVIKEYIEALGNNGQYILYQIQQSNININNMKNLLNQISAVQIKSFTLENINKLIKDADDSIFKRNLYYQQVQQKNALNDVISRLSNLKLTKSDETLKEELTRVENEIRNAKNSENILICPHCNGNLRFLNYNLVKADTKPISKEEIISLEKIKSQVIQELNKYNDSINLSNRYLDLKRNIIDLGINDLLSENDCRLIKQLQYIEEPKLKENVVVDTINFMNIQNERIRINTETQKIEKPEEIHPESINLNIINDLNQEINKIDISIQQKYTLLNTIIRENDKYTKINEEISGIEKSIKTINLDNNPEKDYENINKEIQELEVELKTVQTSNYVKKWKEYLDTKLNEGNSTYNYLIDLRKVKDISEKTEYEKLDSVINTINIYMNSVLKDIFDIPLTAELSLLKELKTDKRLKRQVNMIINYKGSSYELNQLSGGEQSRLSLAFLIALNSVNNFPIILLDETMSSLDDNLRTLCVTAIKKNLPNKMILCINHSDIEGNYDTVLKF